MADKKDNDFRKQHRMRVKTKVYENGFSGLNDIDLLELMLFYAIPYKDVKPLAHRLIDTFGSLSRVLEADLGALENVEGMGASSAIFIKGICQTASRCMIERTCASDEPLDTKRACEIGISLLCMEKNEVFAAIFLDNSGNVLKAQKIFEGTVKEVEIAKRKFMEIALSLNTSAIVLMHNHPHGICLPSMEDINLTSELILFFRSVNIDVKDHIIVSSNESFSMRSSYRFKALFD